MLNLAAFRLKTIRASFRAESDLHFNRYPGFALRSCFGQALFYVSHPGVKDLPAPCSDAQNCAFCQAFRAGDRGVRAPLILSGVPLAPLVERGAELSFSLTLLGQATAHQKAIIAALVKMEEFGVGYAQPRTEGGAAGRLKLLSIANLQGEAYPFSLECDRLEQRLPPSATRDVSELLIEPLTPLRISQPGKKNVIIGESEFTPWQLFHNLLAKIFAFARDHNFGPTLSKAEQADLEELAANCTLRWAPPRAQPEGEFFCSGQHRQLRLSGGVLRSFYLHGELEALLPVLYLGQFLHVGTPAAYGLGEYRIHWKTTLAPPSPDEQTATPPRRPKAELSAEQVLTNVIVDAPGKSLGKRRSNLAVLEDDRVLSLIPIQQVQQVFITAPGVSVSANIVELLAEQGIPVSFLNSEGEPYAHLLPVQKPRADLLSAQLAALQNRRRDFAAELLLAKMTNQQRLVRYWLKSRSGAEAELLQRASAALGTALEGLKREFSDQPEGEAAALLSFEAQAAAHYWGAFKTALKGYEFPGRRHQEAQDVINQALNYGYGFLYSKAQIALLKAGLSPYLGFLHQSDRGAPVLVFDFVEPFRQPMVDREIMALANRGKPLLTEQGRLSDATRRDLIVQLTRGFAKPESYRGRLLTRDQIINAQARELANAIAGVTAKYKAYVLIHW